METKQPPQPAVKLPSLPGTYALVLASSERAEIPVGRLGMLAVEPGYYVYAGSALGAGGLASRVGRHARADKPCRWHIDSLTAVATLVEVWYSVDAMRRECRRAEALGKMRGATVSLKGFGSSDCWCDAHLFFFRKPPSLGALRSRLARCVPNQGSVCSR